VRPWREDPSSASVPTEGPSVRVWTYEATDFLPREDIVVRYRR